MKTGCLFTFTGPGGISIARWMPSALPAFPVYRPLNPADDMLKLPLKDYLPRYQAILAQLDPERVWDDLHRLAGDAEPVLLCWERPPFTSRRFCHRRLVADWLAERLQEEVPEIGAPATPQLALF